MYNISVTGWIIRFVILVVLFIFFFMGGSLAVSGLFPDLEPEAGLVSFETAILLIAVANTLLVTGLVLSSRWSGWKLALWLSFAYFGAVTFVMQIETWYFLTHITVGAQLLPRLFVIGLPVAVFFLPLAVWLLGKGGITVSKCDTSSTNPALIMTARQWLWKLAVIVAAYLVLYWVAGYFIAWQNPALRAFYGSLGEALPFWSHTVNSLQTQCDLFLFQALRALLWTAFALPVIRGSKVGPWWTAVLLGFLFSVPQNIGHIMANPLIPVASVRLSHMIETASSTFVFGMIVAWLLHREHKSLRDLFGMGGRKGFSVV